MLELVTTHVQGSFKLLHSEMKSVLLYTFIINSAAGGYNLIIFYILLFDILPTWQYALQPPPACSLLHTYTKTSYILYTCTGNINVSLTMQSSQFPSLRFHGYMNQMLSYHESFGLGRLDLFGLLFVCCDSCDSLH